MEKPKRMSLKCIVQATRIASIPDRGSDSASVSVRMRGIWIRYVTQSAQNGNQRNSKKISLTYSIPFFKALITDLSLLYPIFV